MEETKVPKYALQHFLFVGILASFAFAYFIADVINNLLPSTSISYLLDDAILIGVILCGIYVGNVLFAKIIKTNIIPSDQISKAARYFLIFVFFFSVLQLPGLLYNFAESNMRHLSTSFFPIYIYIAKLIVVPLAYLIISRKYFIKKEF